ncbi:Bromodomain-like superfamily [Sesbania bispinosa]|nr:Bromodomain-like superfamily [Sesbania bispinosa]
MQDGQFPWNTISAGTYVTSLDGVPDKKMLENVLDYIQRKDSNEFFAEPMNPDVGGNYYKVVKEPMDFGTMRAKLYEGLYTNIEGFKRDVYLICFNAMTAFPSNSRYYKAAEDVNSHARRFFEDFGSALSNFELELFLNKKRQSRKDGKVGTSKLARASPKPAGRNSVTHPKAPRTQRRDTYLNPSNKPWVSEFLTANKPNIQLNIDPGNYKDSLLAFVEDLGPTAKKVADKKLEALKFQQPLNGDTPIPNIVRNVSANRLTQVHPTYLIPGSQPKILESMSSNSFSMPTFTPNRRSKEIMPSINLSGPSFMPQRRTIETMTGINLSGPSLLQQIRPEQALARINFSGPSFMQQRRPEETMPEINLSGPSFMQQRRPEETISGINLSGPSSFMQQRRPEETMPGINLPGPSSFMQQRRPKEIIPIIDLSEPSFMTQIRADGETMPGFDLSGPSFMPQIRDEEIMGPSINPSSSRLSLMSQPRPQDSMSDMNPSNASFWSLLNGGTALQPGGFQALLDTPDLNNSPYPNQELSQMNPFNPVPLQETMPSPAPEIPLVSVMNYNGESVAAGGQREEEASLQFLWDNEEPPPNLSLQL